jgi:hypothetical protein
MGMGMMGKGKLHWCSVCDPANQNWMKKNQNMSVWLSKIVLAEHFSPVL